ncbi:hypothetical protein LINPERPRIM_LOCUS13312, partial [Linum perenne]
CVMCGADAETIQHLFRECTLASQTLCEAVDSRVSVGTVGERNARVFRNLMATPDEVIFRIALMVGRWCIVGAFG